MINFERKALRVDYMVKTVFSFRVFEDRLNQALQDY